MNKELTPRDCKESFCFFWDIDFEYINVCSHCVRNKNSIDVRDDYSVKIKESGY